MKYQEAKQRVLKQVLSRLDGFSLIENAAQEFDHCFTFYYQINDYIKSQSLQDMAVGHGVVLVCKKTASVFETGSALPPEHYINTLKLCGDPNASLTSTISMYDRNEGAVAVTAIKLVRDAGYNLKQAKDLVELAIEGNDAIINAKTVNEATKLVAHLNKSGFRAKQLWANQIK